MQAEFGPAETWADAGRRVERRVLRPWDKIFCVCRLAAAGNRRLLPDDEFSTGLTRNAGMEPERTVSAGARLRVNVRRNGRV
jgi:hypothetical protein